MMTFFLAGSETTATSMTWFLIHLYNHQQVETKLREEIERVVGTNPLEMQQVQQLPYFNAVSHSVNIL